MQVRTLSHKLWPSFAVAAPLLLASSLAGGQNHSAVASLHPLLAQDTTAKAGNVTAPGVPFTAEKLSSLLPATVYFQGRSAPLQLRNAAGTVFGSKEILWAALVDTSGYSTSVQERYQFYFVSEGPLRMGEVAVPAGAYGAGFLGDHFILMDPGGHTVFEGPLHSDADLKRPRPLQIVPDGPSSVKLYLGRHWVLLHADTASATPATK